MINDKIYKNLGITVLVIIAIYVVLKGFNYQTRLIEKLTNKTDEETGKETDKLTVMEKVRQQTKMLSEEVIKREETGEVLYSEYLMEIDELISNHILLLLTSDDFTKNITKNKSLPWPSMYKMKQLNQFRQTLSDAANAWDNRNK